MACRSASTSASASLVAGEGVTIVDDPEIMIAALLPPRVQEEEVVAVEETAEPEVIGGQERRGVAFDGQAPAGRYVPLDPTARRV